MKKKIGCLISTCAKIVAKLQVFWLIHLWVHVNKTESVVIGHFLACGLPVSATGTDGVFHWHAGNLV